MLKVLKNLKESFWKVLFIVILLCVQATADLRLPDYTSKIVNTGIQSGGIESALPEIILSQDIENILLFTNEDEKILSNYSLVGKNPNNYEEKVVNKYIGKNKNIKENTVYVLKDINSDERKELENIIVNPIMILNIIQNEEMANKIKDVIASQMPETQKQYIYSKELIDIIKQIPEEQKNAMLSEYTKQINEMADSIKIQSAISSVKEIYKRAGVDTDKIQNNYILFTGFQMLCVALISMVSAVVIMLLSSKVAARLGKTLRNKIFKKVISFSNKELTEFSTASLITRNTNDVQQIQMLLAMLFRVVVYAPIMGIGGFIKVLTNTDNTMAWIIGIAILAILFVVGTLFIIAMPKFKKLQDLIDKLNLVSREILTGIPVIRAFNTEKREEERFEKANFNLMKTNIFVNRAMSMMMPLLMFIMNSIAILIVWVGAGNVDKGIMQVGDMMAFIQYTMQIVMSFLMISMISIMLPRAAVSANRINEVIETEPSIKDKKATKKFDETKKGLVEFKNVSFGYPDADTEVLSDINFTAKPGEVTAIIRKYRKWKINFS